MTKGARLHALRAIIVLSAVAAIAACSSSGNSSSGNSGTTSSAASAPGVATAKAAAQAAEAAVTKIPQSVSLSSPLPKGKLAIFVGTSEPGDVLAQKGFQASVQSWGWAFKSFSYDPANPATFNLALSNALAQHPAVVASAGTPQSVISAGVFSAYEKAGVPMILDGTAPCTVNQVIKACAATTPAYLLAGKELADWFIADSSGTGKALFETAPGFPVLVGVPTGFAAEVKRLCAGCAVKMVNVSLEQVAGGSVPAAVVAAARTNPSYKYLFFDDADFALGINSALSGAGLSGYKIGGKNLTTQGADALRSGTQSVWTGDNGILDGYLIADATARLITHSPGLAADSTKPEQLLVSSNIGSISVYNEPADALQQFEKLWGVGS